MGKGRKKGERGREERDGRKERERGVEEEKGGEVVACYIPGRLMIFMRTNYFPGLLLLINYTPRRTWD